MGKHIISRDLEGWMQDATEALLALLEDLNSGAIVESRLPKTDRDLLQAHCEDIVGLDRTLRACHAEILDSEKTGDANAEHRHLNYERL